MKLIKLCCCLFLSLNSLGSFSSLNPFSSLLQAQQSARLLTSEIAQLDSRMQESSGLAWHGDSLWTHNDSGDTARVFQLNLRGELLREIVIGNAQNVDWESMAHDADYLYVADTGNNANTRSEFSIYRIAWEDLLAGQADAERISIRYSDHISGDRMSHNFDAEGLTVWQDELWLFSKNRGDQQSKLYRFPKLPGQYVIEPSQSLPVNALVTAADIHPETGRLVLTLSRRGAGTFLWSAATTFAGVDIRSATEIEISPTDQWEALVFDPHTVNRLYLSHEDNSRDYAGLAWVILE